MSAERCMCGATDCPSCAPAQGYRYPPVSEKRVEEEMENAMEHVTDTIVLFGRYPRRGRIQFDLYDFMLEKQVIDSEDLREYMLLSLGDYSHTGPFEDARDRHTKTIYKALREHLKDSAMVREKAEEYAEEE